MSGGRSDLLGGVRIVDLTMFVAGPYCTMLLADLGAEVIKVEPPAGDPVRSNRSGPGSSSENIQFQTYNRNKRGLVLDLKNPEGVKVLADLVRASDALVENFRPGVLERLGFDWEQLQSLNPRLVLCSLSAFGQDGPWALRPGYDMTVQALGGGMSLTGHPATGPAHIPFHLGDTGGGLFAALGLVAALHQSARTGRGRRLDISMLDAQVALLGDEITNAVAAGEDPPQHGSGHPAFYPYGAFQTADMPIAVAAVGVEKFWQNLCGALGRPDLAQDPRFAGNGQRARNRAELEPVLNGIFRQKNRAEWLAILEKADVPASPIHSVLEAVNSPQIRHRHMIQEVEAGAAGRVSVPGNPIDAGPSASFAAAPTRGGEGAALLRSVLGYDDARLSVLRGKGII